MSVDKLFEFAPDLVEPGVSEVDAYVNIDNRLTGVNQDHRGRVEIVLEPVGWRISTTAKGLRSGFEEIHA